MAKRRFKTRFTYQEVNDYFISEFMTVKELKSLIRSFTGMANKIKYKGLSTMESLREEIIEYTGVSSYIRVRGRKQETIGYGFSGKRKSELIKQAQLLQSYIREAYTVRETKRGGTERARKAHKTFNETFGEDTDFVWYMSMVRALASISDILREFGSKTVQQMMYDYKKYMSPIRIADLARKVYNEFPKGETRTPRKLADRLHDAILDELVDEIS